MFSRLATKNDIPDIMNIVADAQRFLAENGVRQWQDGYPIAIDFEEDIDNKALHVIEIDGRLAGVIALYHTTEKDYFNIFDGAWKNLTDNYVVFHRSATADFCRGQGVGKALIALAFDFFRPPDGKV